MKRILVRKLKLRSIVIDFSVFLFLLYNVGDRSSKTSAKFYADNINHPYASGEAGASGENHAQHSQHQNAYQSNYRQYHQPPLASNQVSAPSRKTQRTSQPIPKISINSNPPQHQSSVHSTSGNPGLITQFESVNI